MTDMNSTPFTKHEGEYRRAEQAMWDRFGLAATELVVEVDGLPVRLHEVGSGPPVLFIHGTGGAGVYWAPLVAQLRDSYRCLLLDRPGWARTQPIDYSDPGFAAVVVRLLGGTLDGLGLEGAHLAGGSIGDLFALRYAIEHPSRVHSVVLVGSGPLIDTVEPPTFIKLLRSPLGNIMIRIPQKAGMVRKQLQGLGHQASLNRGLIPDEFIEYHVAMSRHTDTMRHERNLVRSVLSSRGWTDGSVLKDDELGRATMSTLMVLGSEDPIGSPDLWRRFTESLSNAELVVIPEGGHLPWYDDPVGVADRVRRHLDGNSAAG